MKVPQIEKRKKLLGFSFYIDIGYFEAFLRNLNLSAKHLFWRCVVISLLTQINREYIIKLKNVIT